MFDETKFDRVKGTYNGTLIIAEVKLWSPRGERLTQNSWERQLELADRIGGMVSIHTHEIWKGSFGHLVEARKRTRKPILAKGFHHTNQLVYHAIDCGADYVLVVGRQPVVLADKCFLEPLTLAGLRAIPTDCPMGVWNSRDLASLKDLAGIPSFLLEHWSESGGESDRKRETFQEARSAWSGRLCQASNLRTVDDIAPGTDAVLVGTHLEEFAASLGVTL